MFSAYIIYSGTLDRYYYVGYCSNIEERLSRHRSGRGSTYMKKARDWGLCWYRNFGNRSEAIGMERSIKKRKSRKYIEKLIMDDGGS